ncbi:hypothetical protein CAOG_02985 [Capsaspora owczarzaki ATCC 30864]|uniref:hypothetical protein n=1 Tax=Capsaspora owczarzaki (strain ATCC 30864) TaxID=595528 RepID=UPI00035252B8|nr:hypothetical protein CAOG_02985 [Capsaspora owczarzaki ATCC 30864]|eukprot:XP_004363824.2 hypothetical protein CAOG_02985 [Capsaspora owczarzaki ATCC 30864]
MDTTEASSSSSSASADAAAASSSSAAGSSAPGTDEDRSQLIAQLQSITNMESTDQCRFLLEAHDWNLQTAIVTALSMQDEGDRHQTRGSARFAEDLGVQPNYQPSRRTPRAAEPAFARTLANHQVAEAPADAGRAGWLRVGPLATIYDYCWTVVSTLTSWIPIPSWIPSMVGLTSPVVDPLADVTALEREIDERFGRSHPGFFQGSYREASNHSKRELKFLLVYLHSPSHYLTENFCRGVLTSTAFTDFVNENFVFWAGSVRTAEAFDVATLLRTVNYPFLGVVVPLHGQMVLVHRIEGVLPTETVITQLQTAIDAHGAELIVARNERQERAQSQLLRDEQDAAYQQSLAADQEKARRRQAEQERLRAQEEAEAQQARAEEEAIVARERAREDKKRVLAAEPAPNTPGTTRIVLQLPTGSRLERRFYVDDTLQLVHDFVDTQNTGLTNYNLVVRHPVRTITDLSTTLAQEKLVPNALLLVQNLDA